MAGRDRNWGSRSVDIFEKTEQVGEGTYGQVYKAKNKETGEVVALKRVRMDNEKEGFPITAIREIKILKVLNHKNIVRLKEIVTSKGSDYNQGKGSIYMVMEFCDHDLTGLTDAGQKFTVPQIKCYMKQLLEGLAYCHAQKVLHRDIKGSNLLISNDGQLKLADFGLARAYDNEKSKVYTNRVITLWYRPPELLLGATAYGPSIDMWSAGCIFAELLMRKPILPGKNEFEQIDLIFKLLGTPDEQSWPKCKDYQYYDLIMSQTPRKYQNRFEEKFGSLEPLAKDLLRKLLAMDPENRINADDALDHSYFWSDPVPATPAELPKYPPSHEFTAKKRRQSQAQQPQQQPQPQPQPQPSSSRSSRRTPRRATTRSSTLNNTSSTRRITSSSNGILRKTPTSSSWQREGTITPMGWAAHRLPSASTAMAAGASSTAATAVELRRPEAILVATGRTTPFMVATLGAAPMASRRRTARRARPLPRPLELLAPAIHNTTGRGHARRTLCRRPTCMKGLQERAGVRGELRDCQAGRHAEDMCGRRVSTPRTRQVGACGAVWRKRRCMEMQAVLVVAQMDAPCASLRTSMPWLTRLSVGARNLGRRRPARAPRSSATTAAATAAGDGRGGAARAIAAARPLDRTKMPGKRRAAKKWREQSART